MRVTVQLCKFRRTETSDNESGVILNEDRIILDKNFLAVKAPIWSYHVNPQYGYVVLDFGPFAEGVTLIDPETGTEIPVTDEELERLTNFETEEGASLQRKIEALYYGDDF